jgi:hypothetical protein
MPFLEIFTAGYELYLIAAIEGLILMITGIVARKVWQSQGVMAIAIAALAEIG